MPKPNGEPRYDQPEKSEVRNQVIAHAVASLTKDRASSPVVTVPEFDRTLNYCGRFLQKHLGFDLCEPLKEVGKDWRSVWRSRVGSKKAEDLRVLFLSGPDPIADLRAFKEAGIAFANIWAVESDRSIFADAVKAVGDQGLRIKLHNGSLQDFFAIVPQQFDIVYFDACGPLFGGKPNTINVIRELFIQQRLAPLSVLITNFAEPCSHSDPAIINKRLALALAKKLRDFQTPPTGEQSAEEKSLLHWGRVLGLWSYAHGEPDTWLQSVEDFVDTEVLPELNSHYSRFTTEFIIRFAGQLLPWWRVVALPGTKREYFSDQSILVKAVEKASENIVQLGGGLQANLRHALLSGAFLDKNSAASQFYLVEKIKGTSLGDAIKAISLLRNFYESHFGNIFSPTDYIREACNPNLVRVLENFEWFDQEMRIFCDTPQPHLLIDLLVGLYGHPYHANTRALQRIAYKAKETVMFTDVFVFDQARYLYDLLPTLAFFEKSFSVHYQLVLRACMDAIRRHSWFGCPDMFWGCSLASIGEEGFQNWSPPVRRSIGCAEFESSPPHNGDDSPF